MLNITPDAKERLMLKILFVFFLNKKTIILPKIVDNPASNVITKAIL